MKWLPKTLFGQILLALFTGLLLVQLFGLWLMLDDRSSLNYRLLAEYSAQRMAGIVTVLEKAKPAERAGLAQALSVLPTTLSLDIPWQEQGADPSADAAIFRKQVSRNLATPLATQVLSVERADRDVLEARFHGRDDRNRRPAEHDADDKKRERIFPRVVIAQVKLSDGAVVSFHHVLPEGTADLPYRMIALLASLGLSIALLSAWAVRRLTRPLASLADAAAGLARNLNQPPLPENGPQEVHRAAQAFNAMQRDLKRLIDTRSQALSAVSHDLRLPITRMGLRLEAVSDPELQAKMAHDLNEMDTMIGHTLDFLRAGSNVEAPVALNLDALIDSVVEDMEELGATIERQGKTSQPIVARPHALRRCIANLLDNARRYGGGSAILQVEDSSNAVLIRITDHGPGIAQAELEKVFEPYFRLESSRAKHTGGTGLGLAIAKAIIEAHNGTITLESQPEQGLTVNINLPRA